MMNKVRNEIIRNMKSDLLMRVDEWLGMDIPDEGTEDYDTWQSKLDEIDAIENITDVINYGESSGLDVDNFFVCGEYEVISAGLNSKDVPLALVTEIENLIAEQSRDEALWMKVYCFDKKYFVINTIGTKIFDLESNALYFAEIRNKSFDEILWT